MPSPQVAAPVVAEPLSELESTAPVSVAADVDAPADVSAVVPEEPPPPLEPPPSLSTGVDSPKQLASASMAIENEKPRVIPRDHSPPHRRVTAPAARRGSRRTRAPSARGDDGWDRPRRGLRRADRTPAARARADRL